METLLKS